MGGPDLIVSIGTHQQEVMCLGIGCQALEQLECGRIKPLQIVEEEHERTLRLSKHTEKSTEDAMESILGVLRRQIGDRRLLADNERQVGDQARNEPTVRAER